MSQAASQASAFYRDVAKNLYMWVLTRDGAYLQLKSQDHIVLPFWSTELRARRAGSASGNEDWSPEQVSLEHFVHDWVPQMRRRRVMVGVNLSGAELHGFDIEPKAVLQNILGHADTDSEAAEVRKILKRRWWPSHRPRASG